MTARKKAAPTEELTSGVQLFDTLSGLALSPVVATEGELDQFRSIAPHPDDTEVRQIEPS